MPNRVSKKYFSQNPRLSAKSELLQQWRYTKRDGFERMPKKNNFRNAEIPTRSSITGYPHFDKATTIMKTRHFLEYLPKRYKARNEQDIRVRNFIYDFKRGRDRAARMAAVEVANFFFRCFGSECEDYTFVCVPSRNNATYRSRFSYFAREVEELCGCKNAMDHIVIVGERQALHNSNTHCVCESGYDYLIDIDWFKNRKVVIFDDLITSGATARTFADELSAAGATIIGGLFLARTITKEGTYYES